MATEPMTIGDFADWMKRLADGEERVTRGRYVELLEEAIETLRDIQRRARG